jgi:hypothetical protein
MPVEIKELVIRAVVNEGKVTAGEKNAPIGMAEKKILKVIKQLAKQTKQNER